MAQNHSGNLIRPRSPTVAEGSTGIASLKGAHLFPV